jgi:hypothetical protein
MGATILTVSSLKRLDLSNCQILRRPVYLNNWTTMRIGLHFCVPSAANLVGTPRLYVGMGSGLTNGIGDATTTNFVGAVTNQATWTRNTVIISSVTYGYATNVALRTVKRVGSTLTIGSLDMTAAGTFSLDAGWRAILIVEITKGSPNYSITLGVGTSNSIFNAGDEITPALMDQYMSLPIGLTGIGSVKNANYSIVTANNTVATSEVAGNLDCIQIYWDKTAAPLEIEGVYHRKLA